ncbi:hypothetical protein SOASR014_29900 [Pectobacterium carotovorum subsp. carotovorum]|nr:hypothetical protein SOASR014_29900 [Pectobacterium carotovorum subsp. carotovorum]GLX43110.1 hypothetical protein Pcaca01_07780 [Pectobacterium carotovorum subsp. carotovorum]
MQIKYVIITGQWEVFHENWEKRIPALSTPKYVPLALDFEEVKPDVKGHE